MKQLIQHWLARPRRVVIALGGTVLVVGAGVAWYVTRSAARAPIAQELTEANGAAGQAVTVIEVQLGPVNRTLDATGSVVAQELIPVTTQVSGRQIEQVLVEEGDLVQAGQTLAVLDSAVLDAQLLQARASAAEAEARLAELRAGTRPEEIARAQEAVRSAEARVKQDEADLDLITKRVERNELLEAEGAIALDRLDEVRNQERIAQLNLEQAQAQLQEAREQLTELQRGQRPEVIQQAEARLSQAQAQVQSLVTQLSETQIKAPRAGKVAERQVQVGAIANPSTPLFTLIQDSALELALNVPETQIAAIQPGQTVQISSDADATLQLTGQVRRIDPLVSEDSRQAQVKVTLPPNPQLKPGMFLRGRIVTATATGVVIPTAAILPQSDGTSQVFIARPDNTVLSRVVRTGELLANGQVEIIEGLSPGERVVVEGAAYLEDGDKVEVVETEAARSLRS